MGTRTTIRQLLFRLWLVLKLLLLCVLVSIFFVGLAFQTHPLFAFAAFIWVTAAARHYRRRSITFGTARWAEFFDLWSARLLFNAEAPVVANISGLEPPSWRARAAALLFWAPRHSTEAINLYTASANKTYNVHIPDDLCPHLSMTSPTGGGKTRLAAANLFADRSSVIVNDPKNLELYATTGRWRQHVLGQQVICIAPHADPSQLWGEVHRFNPLQLIDPASVTWFDDVRSVSSSLIVEKQNDHNPFFINAARMFCTGILSFMVCELPAEECTLVHLRRIFAVKDRLLGAIKMMKESTSVHREMLADQAGQMESMVDRTLNDVLATLNAELAWIDGPAMTHSLMTTDFNPGDLFNDPNGMTIYFSVPPERVLDYRSYYRVVFTSFTNFIFRTAKDDTRKIRFYLDEAHSLGKLDSVLAALVYGRSYGIRLFFFWQAVGQIEEVFPEARTQVFQANTGQLLANVRDYQTAEATSKWIGRYTVESATRQIGTNTGATQSVTYSIHPALTRARSVGHNHSQSHAETSRELIQPEEILQLSRHHTIILIPSVNPILANPVLYYEDKSFMQRLAEVNDHVATQQQLPQTSPAKAISQLPEA